VRWRCAGRAGVSLTKKFNEVARSQSQHGGEVARFQSLHMYWLRTAMRRVWSPGLSFLDERQVELSREP
jgi:hypothetical protein